MAFDYQLCHHNGGFAWYTAYDRILVSLGAKVWFATLAQAISYARAQGYEVNDYHHFANTPTK